MPDGHTTDYEGNPVIFNDVKALADAAGVSLNAASNRAGINYSTVYRWGQGAEPKPDNLARLRAAVLVIANERGQLPADIKGEDLDEAMAMIAGEATDPREIVQDLKDNLRRLERSLTGGARANAS